MKKQTVKRVKLRVKNGDLVKVIAGSDKGQEGKVINVLTDKQRVVVEGLNMVSKHTKPDAENPQGAIVRKEAPMHISNVMVVDPKTNTPSRIGRKLVDGKLKRFSKKSGEILD